MSLQDAVQDGVVMLQLETTRGTQPIHTLRVPKRFLTVLFGPNFFGPVISASCIRFHSLRRARLTSKHATPNSISIAVKLLMINKRQHTSSGSDPVRREKVK